MRLEQLLHRQKDNNNLAIKYAERAMTYTEWYNSSVCVADSIRSVMNNELLNVAVFLPNSINYAVAYFAVQFLGKVLVPIGIQVKEPEIISTFDYCEIDIVLTDSAHVEFLQQIISNYRYRVDIYNIDSDKLVEGDSNKKNIYKSEYLKQNGTENDVAIMLHTSGTTSNPKRVMLTHNNLINNVESNIRSLKLTQQDKVLIAMPMFFGYCNTAQFLTHLYLGATMVILDSIFLPKQFFQIIEREQITNFTGVPSMLLMLLDYRYSDRYDYSSLKYVCFGGGKMPIEKLKMLIEKYHDIGFVQTYGQTECSPRVTALLPQYSLSKLGSVGTPIPGVNICIFDKSDTPLPNNKIGEIVVKGANTMKGYYKQSEITKKTIRNGWIHTGDLGYIDADGFLYLTGRINSVIISGGINIYPEEIEQILLQYNGVGDACVIGEEHAFLGEVPIAKVVIKQTVTINELRKYCYKNLADYKVPVRFDIVNELPKTYNGKTKRYGGE